MRNRAWHVIAALAVLGAMGACTASTDPSAASDSGGEEAAPASPTVGFTPDAPSTDGETPAGEIEQVPALVDGWDGIVADVSVDSCPTEAGRVTAEGTVVNSADDDRDIAIVISWNAPDSTDSLMQLAVTEKGVPSGETVTCSASGDLPADAGQCVVLARAGTLADG